MRRVLCLVIPLVLFTVPACAADGDEALPVSGAAPAAAAAVPVPVPAATTTTTPVPMPLADLREIDEGTISDVLRSDLVTLSSTIIDGVSEQTGNRRYRLENICVPRQEELTTVAALKKALLGHKVSVRTWRSDDNGQDRYGLPYAHIVSEKDGVWVQEYMISTGLARVCSDEDGGAQITALKLIEDKARKAGAGLWADPAYQIKSPDDFIGDVSTFQIVEGRVKSWAYNGNVLFLNFGDDWRTDFSVKIPGFSFVYDKRRGGEDSRPDAWKGRLLRVRGWVSESNGPMIEVTHRSQIDVLELQPKPKKKKKK